MGNTSLDPKDWTGFRASAHAMLEAALDQMQSASEGPVWRPLPEAMKEALTADLPLKGQGAPAVQRQIQALLPYGVGNTHPRFFGWVHGAGTPGGILAEIAASAMNANLGGRDHGAIYVERQVLDWCRQMMGFPSNASGLIVSGTSMATIVALKTARDRRLGFAVRKTGIGAPGLVGYTSAQTHSCVARTFDMLGLGADALRKIPCNDAFQIDLKALAVAIAKDRAAGLTPFALIGTAGAVNVGAIDDLEALADLAAAENLWFHVDGAFGAAAMLSESLRPRVSGLSRADSLAFDFHKWMHVNYDAGCVLIRDGEAHYHAFAERPEYLAPATRGLAAGDHWPVDYGPELSRGFRALKIWAHLLEHGTEKLGASMAANCQQAEYLAAKIDVTDALQRLAPVALNITCFRYVPVGSDAASPNIDALNEAIVIELQESGVAVPSTTRLNRTLAIRVNITNHRTTLKDMDILIDAVCRIGQNLSRPR